MDALLMNLTMAQEWMHHKKTYREPGLRPAGIANDIERSFNWVSHKRLIEILTHYQFPSDFTACVNSFNTDKSIFMAFDGESEDPVPFKAVLPPGSPLSPILFAIYAACLNDPTGLRLRSQSTFYVDDEVMLEAGFSQNAATHPLKTCLDTSLARDKVLYIQIAPAKCKLIHLIKRSLQQVKTHDPIRLYGTEIICSLRVWIDHRLSFRHHVSAVSAVAARGAGIL